jgi:1-aminocyclopropane-1-carboxylate deaminase/D-cysteine desulfhydrase
VVHASTSGGTHAGLVAGRVLAGGGPRVVGVDAGRLYGDGTLGHHARLATEALARLGVDTAVAPTDLHLVADQVGDGYGSPTPAGLEALRLLAASEGIVTDPVYSAKGLAHLVAASRAGGFGGPVIFWHTGGYQALFDPRYSAEISP